MPEMCKRECCSRPRAKNPRTSEYHDFCSLRCSRMFKQRNKDSIETGLRRRFVEEKKKILSYILYFLFFFEFLNLYGHNLCDFIVVHASHNEKSEMGKKLIFC